MSSLHPNVKHPAILPKESHLSALLIKYHHEKVQHQSWGMTVNELLANRVWIVGCSKAASSYIHKCTTYRKFRQNTEQQRMGNLPREHTPPFTYCGMYCFGPIYVKHGRKELKCYGVLLTCMCSRATHIETLEDLTTDGEAMLCAHLLYCVEGSDKFGAIKVATLLVRGASLPKR